VVEVTYYDEVAFVVVAYAEAVIAWLASVEVTLAYRKGQVGDSPCHLAVHRNTGRCTLEMAVLPFPYQHPSSLVEVPCQVDPLVVGHQGHRDRSSREVGRRGPVEEARDNHHGEGIHLFAVGNHLFRDHHT
jgi:hypothetical protein